MPEQTNQTTPENKPTAEELMAQNKLLQEKLQEQESIRQAILADPNMLQLLKLTAEGKKVKISEETMESQTQRPTKMFSKKSKDGQELQDVNQLSNKEMLELIGESFEEFIDGKLTATLEPVAKKLSDQIASVADGTTKIKQALVAQALATGTANLQKQYPDFSQYSAEVNKVAMQTGLSQEDAYLLLKARKMKDVPPAEMIETERPFTIPVRSRANDAGSNADGEDGGKQTVQPRGVTGFKDILARGVNKAMSRRATSSGVQ